MEGVGDQCGDLLDASVSVAFADTDTMHSAFAVIDTVNVAVVLPDELIEGMARKAFLLEIRQGGECVDECHGFQKLHSIRVDLECHVGLVTDLEFLSCMNEQQIAFLCDAAGACIEGYLRISG